MNKVTSFLWGAIKVIGILVGLYFLVTWWSDLLDEIPTSIRISIGVGVGLLTFVGSTVIGTAKEIDRLEARIKDLEGRLDYIQRQPFDDD